MKGLHTLVCATALVLVAACSSTPKKPESAPAPKAAAAAPAAPAVTNVAGAWVLTIDSQMGSQDSKLTLTQTGKDIAGTIESGQMGTVNTKGTVDGKDIKFGFPFSGQGVELQIDFIGTTDGQTMSGKAVFGSYGEGTFKAKRT